MKLLKQTSVALAAAAMFSAIPSVVRADALAVGTANQAGPSTITLTPGTTVGSLTSLMTATTFTATIRTAVQTGDLLGGVANCAGCLDFFYQITVNTTLGADGDGPNRTTITSFAPASITTNVWQLLNGSVLGLGFVNGTATGTSVDRNTASVVGENFTGNNLVTGQSDLVFVVRTNVTQFTAGTFNAIDGSVGSTGTLTPTLAPEPSTAVLLGSGLFGLVGFARRRKNNA
jgi:hypothetical protein